MRLSRLAVGLLLAAAIMAVVAYAPRASQTSVAADITVPATAGWVGSGVEVCPGCVVTITATADWKPTPQLRSVGPMGFEVPCGATCSTCPIFANHGALIGRVGTNPPFLVGDNFEFIVGEWTGELQFSINDDLAILGDNSGTASVHVDVSGCATAAQQQSWGGIKTTYR